MAFFFGGYGMAQMNAMMQDYNLGLSRAIAQEYRERDRAIHDAFEWQYEMKSAVAQQRAENSMIANAIAIDMHSDHNPAHVESMLAPLRGAFISQGYTTPSSYAPNAQIVYPATSSSSCSSSTSSACGTSPVVHKEQYKPTQTSSGTLGRSRMTKTKSDKLDKQADKIAKKVFARECEMKTKDDKLDRQADKIAKKVFARECELKTKSVKRRAHKGHKKVAPKPTTSVSFKEELRRTCEKITHTDIPPELPPRDKPAPAKTPSQEKRKLHIVRKYAVQKEKLYTPSYKSAGDEEGEVCEPTDIGEDELIFSEYTQELVSIGPLEKYTESDIAKNVKIMAKLKEKGIVLKGPQFFHVVLRRKNGNLFCH